VAVDRAIKIATNYDFEGPVDRWTRLRDEIHADVCRHGFNVGRSAFTQYYGATELDASVRRMTRAFCRRRRRSNASWWKEGS
jgi:GH15 family glucan-1,4-alpha-glucosidase